MRKASTLRTVAKGLILIFKLNLIVPHRKAQVLCAYYCKKNIIFKFEIIF